MKISSYRLLAVFFLLSWGLALRGADPYQSAEAPLNGLAGLPQMLAAPNTWPPYREGLERALGLDPFLCHGLGAVTRDLSKLVQEVPEVGAALWTPRKIPSLTLFRKTEEPRRPERWELAAPPRPLHALWLDPSQRQCAGDRCDKAEITAPERWGVALQGTETFLLFVNGRSDGSGLRVSLLERAGKRYALLSAFGGGRLQQVYPLSSKKTGPWVGSTVLDHFLTAYERRNPDVVPVAVTYDHLNQAVPQVARIRSVEGEDPRVGFLDEFHPADPLAQKISRAVPRRCFGRKSNDGLDLFAGFGNGGPPPKGLDLSDAGLNSFLVNVNSAQSAGEAALSVPAAQIPAVAQGLGDRLRTSRDQSLRRKAAMVLDLLDGVPTEDRPFSSVRPFTPVPRRGLASPQGAKTSPPTKDPFLETFQRGLKDSDPVVRGLAATALADRGNNTPEVRSALRDTAKLSPEKVSGPSPIDPRVLAAAAQIPLGNRGSGGNSLENGFRRAMNENDPVRRQELLDRLAEQVVNTPRPQETGDQIERILSKVPPEQAQEFVDRINSQDCEARSQTVNQQLVKVSEGALLGAKTNLPKPDTESRGVK